MRKIKTYNVIIKRGEEKVKEIHTNNALYAWNSIKRWYEDESGAEYIDRRYDTLHITFGENDKERGLDEIREACWRNGYFSVK